MLNNRTVFFSICLYLTFIVITGCSLFSSPREQTIHTVIDASSLTQTLVDSLGISYTQAQTGATAFLHIADNKLGSAAVEKIRKAIPDSAMIFPENVVVTPDPKEKKPFDGCSYLISKFHEAGLRNKMIPAFAAVITAFLKQTGHDETAQMFKSSIANTFSEHAHATMHSLSL